MSVQVRVEKLEELLARIRKNARSGARETAAVGAEEEPILPVAEDEIEDLDDVEDIEELPEEETWAASAVPASQAEPSAPEPEESFAELPQEELSVREEPTPRSQSAPRTLSLDDAFAESVDEPPLTPPPESGETEASGLHLPAQAVPTMEQLGETISLEEGPHHELELDEPLTATDKQEEKESLPPSHWEAELPDSQPTQASELQAPPEAREELARLRLGQVSELTAEVITRPRISTNIVDFVEIHRKFQPATFLELLDASLRLK